MVRHPGNWNGKTGGKEREKTSGEIRVVINLIRTYIARILLIVISGNEFIQTPKLVSVM